MNTIINGYINDVYCYTKIRGKKAMGFIKQYRDSKEFDIFQAYVNPSYRKIQITCDIEDIEMTSLEGYDFRILSHNCQMFTCGYRVVIDDVEYLIVHTPTYRYLISLQYIK